MNRPIPLRTPVEPVEPPLLRVLSEEETGLLRRKVREALAVLPAAYPRATHKMVHESVLTLTAFRPDKRHTQDALEWNHERGFVEKLWNHDFDRDEFCITNKGRAKDAE